MRAPFQKAPTPRIRALDGAARTRPSGSAKAGVTGGRTPASASGQVFREFVATLERLDKVRRRKLSPDRSGREG